MKYAIFIFIILFGVKNELQSQINLKPLRTDEELYQLVKKYPNMEEWMFDEDKKLRAGFTANRYKTEKQLLSYLERNSIVRGKIIINDKYWADYRQVKSVDEFIQLYEKYPSIYKELITSYPLYESTLQRLKKGELVLVKGKNKNQGPSISDKLDSITKSDILPMTIKK
jgi:hypothetical protein